MRCQARVQHKADEREMRRYMSNPMPYCTWGPESGPVSVLRPEWRGARYTLWNGGVQYPRHGRESSSGKYQFLRSTWHAIGGARYADVAAEARPVVQERMARVLLRVSGLGAWNNC